MAVDRRMKYQQPSLRAGFFLILLFVGLRCGVSSFSFDPKGNRKMLQTRQRRDGSRTQLGCICIHCSHVTNCAAYHFVETQHGQPHMNENPTFEPLNGSPTINVEIRSVKNEEDQQKEVERMWREHEAETQRAMENQVDDKDPLYGEKTYSFIPSTTYEYDVVKCASFVEEKDCWVRNMPEEIRLVNPDFVPP